jgi:hypothetical protein
LLAPLAFLSPYRNFGQRIAPSMFLFFAI